MIKVLVDGQETVLSEPISLCDLSKRDKSIFCALVNNRLRALDFIVNKDCKIDFVRDSEGRTRHERVGACDGDIKPP